MCVTQAHEHASEARCISTDCVDHQALVRIDAALVRMRRITVKPPLMSLPIPGSPRRVEFAKLLACTTIKRLSAQPDAVTVKAVASALDLEHSTASRLLTEAEQEGLISRLPHPDDRRSSVLALTDAGEAVCTAFDNARLRFMAGTFAGWSSTDVEAFAELLERFITDITCGREQWGEWIDPRQA
jgi:DNA-binding MarR family transcriptional regulator